MQAVIIRTQEITNAGFMARKNVKLSVEITVSLSGKELELVNKYFDPRITPKILEEFASSDTLSTIKIVEPMLIGMPLSKLKLVAYTDDGFKSLGNMENLVKAVIHMAREKMVYVQRLEEWQGRQEISIE